MANEMNVPADFGLAVIVPGRDSCKYTNDTITTLKSEFLFKRLKKYPISKRQIVEVRPL